MNIVEAYKTQQKVSTRIRFLEDRSYEDPDFETPEVIAEMSDLRSELAAIQNDAGGRIFRVPVENLHGLNKKLRKFARQSEKNGAPAPTVVLTDEKEEEIRKDRGQEYLIEWTYIVAGKETPSLEGWTFVAALDHSLEKTIINVAPGQDVDLSDYRDADPVCDHCNKIRSRKDTYIVKHEDGTIKQVGRTCLQDFISTLTPARIVSYFEFLREVEEVGEIDPSEGGFGGGVKVWKLDDFLSHSAAVIRENGWTPASAYGVPTKQQVSDNLFEAERKTIKNGVPQWIEPTDEDKETARKAREFAQAINPESDFEHNLKAIADSDHIQHRHFGFAAYLIEHYRRATETRIREEKAEAFNDSEINVHIGQPKDRLDLILTVTRIHATENAYGGLWITNLVDEKGHNFKWFGSYPLTEGETYEGKWTIKKHDEWQGKKETVITRPKLKETR